MAPLASSWKEACFLSCSFRTTGYISEGERTTDNQLEQAATLYMITPREILSELLMTGHNKHQNWHSLLNNHYRRIEYVKSDKWSSREYKQ